MNTENPVVEIRDLRIRGDRELRGHELVAAHEAGVGQEWPVTEGELQTAEGSAFLRDLHGRQPEQNHGKDQHIARGAHQRNESKIDAEEESPELSAGGDAEARHDAGLGEVPRALVLVSKRRDRGRAR